jgi:hypothetical protein
MIDRRGFLGAVAGGLLASPRAVEAQPAGRGYRIVYLGNSSAALEADLVDAFRQGLRNLNYVEGQNIVIEYRWAEGRTERFPALVAEAVGLKADVILTSRHAGHARREGRDPHDSYCHRGDGRPHRRRCRSKPRASWWEHHRVGLDEP